MDISKMIDVAELQSYCNAQYKSLEVAAQKIKQLEEENAHLKSLLTEGIPLLENTTKIIKTPAEIICEMQIERLQDIALTRALTLEETKQLDLFIKNFRLLKGDSTEINGEVKKLSPKHISEATLIQIASNKHE